MGGGVIRSTRAGIVAPGGGRGWTPHATVLIPGGRIFQYQVRLAPLKEFLPALLSLSSFLVIEGE